MKQPLSFYFSPRIDGGYSKYAQVAFGIELAMYKHRGPLAWRLTLKFWKLRLNLSTVKTLRLTRDA